AEVGQQGPVSGQDGRSPAPAPVAGDDGLTGPDPQDPAQVVLVLLGQRGRTQIVDEDERPGQVRGVHGQRKADLILAKNPESAGATSSPRSSANCRRRSSCSSVRSSGTWTTTRTIRSPRTRRSTCGTPLPRSRNSRPVAVPRG